jgi:murein DD-endopeptidase MepM/ murein hydrolase activator NlpD
MACTPFLYWYIPLCIKADFAATIRNPDMAAGDGVIEMAGKKGGYGNYVGSGMLTAIRHFMGI